MDLKLKNLFLYLKIFVSALIILGLIIVVGKIDIANLNVNINLTHAFLILVLLSLSLFFRAQRWKILMNDQKGKSFNIWFSLKLLLIGQSLNIIMPAGTGDIAKSYFGYKITGEKERMFSVSVFDKLLAIASIGFLAIFSTFYSKNYNYLLLVLLSITPILGVLYFDKFIKIKFIKKIIDKINNKIHKKIDLYNIIYNLRFSKVAILKSTVISIIAWILTYYLLFIIFEIFNLGIPFQTVLLYSPILTLARLFPFTLNGIGSDEAVILYLFSNFSNESSIILIAALFYRLVLMILPAIPGVFLIIISKNKKD